MSAGWVPITSTFDCALSYWHKPIDEFTRLSVKGRTWKLHRRLDKRYGWTVAASGEGKSSADAKRQAERVVFEAAS